MTTTVKHPLMHPTHIDLPEKKREKLVDLLNQALAHLIDLNLQVKQAHWNVKGMRFIALHELFDMLYEELKGQIDTVAERATTLAGAAQGTLQAVAKASTLDEYPLAITSGEEHLKALVKQYAHVAKLVRNGIDEAEELDDKSTADVFTEISRGLDMRLWFLEAHLQDK
ncbi:MAG: DNA starvation/stationary phase protection protein Dps [Candidatus Melainabacteria bacterium]